MPVACFQETGKIMKNVKNDDFWPELLIIMTFPWQHQISWAHGGHIKISTRDE